MYSINPSCSFRSSVVAPKEQPKTSQEILKEKTHKDAQVAKNKPAEDRTVGDYLSIGLDTVNNLTNNVPVVYANSPSKLNYMV